MPNDNKRDEFIDYAKAIAILMVLLGHSIEQTRCDNTLLVATDLLLYTLHVPTFLFCSGYLFKYTLQRHSDKEIILRAIFDLLLVWFMWSVILTGINYVVDVAFGKCGATLKDYVAYSTNEVWYLWFLAFCQIALVIVQGFIRNIRVILVPMLLLFIGLCFFHVGIAKVVVHFIIFILGYLTDFKKEKYRIHIKGACIGGLYIFIMGMIYCTNYIQMSDVNNRDIKTIALLSIKLLACMVVPYIMYMINLHGARHLLFIGQNSLYVYILHFMPLALYKALAVDIYYGPVLFLLIAVITSIMLAKLIMRMVRIDKCLFKPFSIIRNMCNYEKT